jgi:hypothetical protein
MYKSPGQKKLSARVKSKNLRVKIIWQGGAMGLKSYNLAC